ncbi:MAG: diaminopimelate epimerase [Bacteroidetes bacterium]|nr:diaminopimelate epimerase [Bacteroidota bacterium]
MRRPLVVEFVKMNGSGNDFIVVDNRFYAFSDDELGTLAARYCPRRTGVGADGLLAFEDASSEAYDFRMRYRNADGSPATMCGNGARCLAAFARVAGLTADPLRFQTDAGVYRAMVSEAGERVRLFVPPPERFAATHALATASVPGDMAPSFIWTGTEHLVCFVDGDAQANLETWAPALRHDPSLAPDGANVNAVHGDVGTVADRRPVLRVRTYEKGVEAETLACGTGALAAAVTARLQGHIAADAAHVDMPGGRLTVGWTWNDGQITDLYLEGAVERVFRGTLEVRL